MILYRWYVGLDKRPSEYLEGVVAGLLNSATIYYTRGLWHGQYEDSAVVEVISPTLSDKQARAVGEKLRVSMEQTNVLLTNQTVEVER